MHIDLYNKLIGVTKFKDLHGKTYQEYIIKSINLPNKLKYEILECKKPGDALKLLNKNQISFTHNYLEAQIPFENNITLTIIEKDICLLDSSI